MNQSAPPTDFVRFHDVVDFFWSRRLIYFGVVSLSIALGVLYYILKDRVYEVKVVLAPVEIDSQSVNLAGLGGGLGGLAENLGVSLGGGSKADETLARMRSRNFISKIIQDLKIKQQLFPADWDAAKGSWAVGADDVPSDGLAHKKFIDNVLTVEQDKTTELVYVTVRWTDPKLAAAWSDAIVTRINKEVRTREAEKAQKTIDRLLIELERTQLAKTRDLGTALIAGQLRTLAMTKALENYAFDIIDPPYVPAARDHVAPRAIYVLPISVVLGGIVAFLIHILLWWRERSLAQSSNDRP